jgi:hypothetical protein
MTRAIAENDLEEIVSQIRGVGERPETARRIGEAIRNDVNARANYLSGIR